MYLKIKNVVFKCVRVIFLTYWLKITTPIYGRIKNEETSKRYYCAQSKKDRNE